MDRPLFLVGFMGCGKSTVGRRLARELGVAFVDLDRVVEAEAGLSIPEIFAREGEEGFRRREELSLEGILADRRAMVVATGGGTPMVGDAMARMVAAGWVVYLYVPEEVLVARLGRGRGRRPMIAGMDDRALAGFVAERLGEREGRYREAHVVVDALSVRGDMLLSMLRMHEEMGGGAR